MTNILEKSKDIEHDIIAWRRDIHAHPELSFEETRTANLVASTLRDMGLEVEVGIGKTGVVARIGEGDKVIGIRADMDALPIQEATGLPFASTSPNKMHACGHDAHTAMLLGVAKVLHNMPDRPNGEIRLLFQPSEEAQDADDKSGAFRMIEDGALQGVDAIIALHVNSGTPAGTIEIADGLVSASVDMFEAVIKGEGAHGAHYHLGVDPIYILAQVINAIHGIKARRIDPVKAAVISIGAVHGGSAENVIPSEVYLNGTIRAFDKEVRTQLHQELKQAFEVARVLGGDYKLTLQLGCPSMHNDTHVSNLIASAATDLFGSAQVAPLIPAMGGEDFSYFQELIPGAMFILGAKKDEINRPHHNPLFDIEESVFHQGTALLAETAVRWLADA